MDDTLLRLSAIAKIVGKLWHVWKIVRSGGRPTNRMCCFSVYPVKSKN